MVNLKLLFILYSQTQRVAHVHTIMKWVLVVQTNSGHKVTQIESPST